MKTQITDLINGSERTIRNLNAAKYESNPIGFYNFKENAPKLGGTPLLERKALADIVDAENPGDMVITANGVDLTLTRYTSTTGKSWRWESKLSAAQFKAISGKEAPVWFHARANNSYSIIINGDCTVQLFATSGKKGIDYVLGEEFIIIR